jgi:hypothetical protein
MGEFSPYELLEFSDQLVDTFGRQIQPEELDGHEPIAIGLIRTEYRTQRTRTDLMKHAKRTEGIGGRRAGNFRVQ